MSKGICPKGNGTEFHLPVYIMPGSFRLDQVWCRMCHNLMVDTGDGWVVRTKFPPEPAPPGEE